jgi:NADH-quinone oxidoreductase subunit J
VDFAKIFFLLSAILTVGGAILVVVSKNLMHSCVYLLTSLLGVAGLYVTLSADFVAATQLMVYVGGVVILMLFAVMLTRGTESNTPNRFGLSKIPGMGNKKTYIIASVWTLVIASIVAMIIKNVNQGVPSKVDSLNFISTVEALGALLVTDHILAFEFSSILLLGALVGAAIIARPKKG